MSPTFSRAGAVIVSETQDLRFGVFCRDWKYAKFNGTFKGGANHLLVKYHPLTGWMIKVFGTLVRKASLSALDQRVALGTNSIAFGSIDFVCQIWVVAPEPWRAC